MRRIIFSILLVVAVSCQLRADTIWMSGYHEIFAGDTYDEIWLENDAIVDMWGGDVYQLGLHDLSVFNMYGGTMTCLMAGDNTAINLHGGNLDMLDIGENSILNLYAYEVQYHSTGGYWNGGWIEGKYLTTNDHFYFDIRNEDVFLSYVNIIPEPATFLLVGLGGLLLRRRK